MNLASDVRSLLKSRGILSAAESSQVSISIAIGEVARRKESLVRRFIVSKAGLPVLNVKLLPPHWPFSPADIVETQESYGGLGFFKVLKLLDHFSTDEGHYFVEQYLPSAVPLVRLVERGELNAPHAVEVVKQVLLAVWTSGSNPNEEFIATEKSKYRTYLSHFLQPGPLADSLYDHIDAGLAAASPGFRRVMSSGDIIDRNILRVGGDWYLVDFEFSHPTLFFFKDAYRNILYSSFCMAASLRDLFPFSNVSDEVAIMLSLAWEAHLYEDVLEAHTRVQANAELRRRFWTIADSSFSAQTEWLQP